MFPRKKRPLLNLINTCADIKARSCAWGSGQELLDQFKQVMSHEQIWIPLEANPEILNQVFRFELNYSCLINWGYLGNTHLLTFGH